MLTFSLQAVVPTLRRQHLWRHLPQGDRLPLTHLVLEVAGYDPTVHARLCVFCVFTWMAICQGRAPISPCTLVPAGRTLAPL